MIDVSRLYCGGTSSGDGIRYGHGGPGAPSAPRSAAERRPVVVWNVTRTCNLRCIHCYTDSDTRGYADELTTDEGKALLDAATQWI